MHLSERKLLLVKYALKGKKMTRAVIFLLISHSAGGEKSIDSIIITSCLPTEDYVFGYKHWGTNILLIP